MVHQVSNIKVKIQLYLFLFQYHSYVDNCLSDRYYRSLYEFLLCQDILGCSLHEMFFDLLIVSIEQDDNLSRVQAFIKRVLQLCLSAQPNFIVTTLIMISRIIQSKEPLKIVLGQKENHMHDEDAPNS